MDIVSKIKLSIKKNRENVLLDLYLRDYDASNFYFALVFSKKINKFKVLFVPIDAVYDGGNISDYFCYQFIFIDVVNYLVNKILKNEININDTINNKNSTMDSYYIEINTYVSKTSHKYMFSQYIDKEYLFLFDIITTLFEYLPNIVNELCGKLLMDFNERIDVIRYTDSVNFDLYNSELKLLFNKDKYKYDYNNIIFLEEFNNKWYAYINEKIIIVEYLRGRKILNISCPGLDIYSDEVYIVLEAIKDYKVKEFYHLEIVLDNEFLDIGTYLCYGVDNNNFKIISKNVDKLNFSLIAEKVIKINYDAAMKKILSKYLEDKYNKKKAKELLEFLKG